MIEHFFTVLAACGGLPLPPLRGPPPPPPRVRGGKFMEEKGTASLHPLPTPVSGEGGECSEPEGVSRKAAFLLTGI